MAETVTIYLNTVGQTGGLKTVIDGLGQVKESASNLDSWLKRASKSLTGMVAGVVGVGAVGAALKGAITQGIGFNKTLEDARLGIAAVLKQFNPQAFKTFDDALKASGDAIDLLKKKAVESPASFQQLVSGFQAISGAASGAGIALNDQVNLVVLLSQALAGLGIRNEQLIQESRALITGNINEDALAARILGITKKDIEHAKEQGKLYDFLRTKLSAFAEAGKIGASNFSTALSNLGDVVQQKLGELTVPIFEALKEGVLRLTTSVNEGNLEGAFSNWAAAIAKVVSALFTLGRIGVENIRAITTAVEALTLAFTVLAVRAGLALGGTFIPRLASVAGWFGVVNTAVAATSKLAGPLAGLVAIFKSGTGAVSVFLAAFAGFKLGSLINDFDLLGKGLGVFGIKVKDVLVYDLLKAMEVWEKFKLSVGLGSQSMLAGIQDSIQEVLAPKIPGQQKTTGTTPPPKKLELVTSVENYRLLLEQNATRIAMVEKEISIKAEERNSELRDIYAERATMVADLQTELQKKVTQQVGTDDQGAILFTKEYAEASKELNSLLKEQAEIRDKIHQIDKDDFELKRQSIDVEIGALSNEQEKLKTRGLILEESGRTVGTLKEEAGAVKQTLLHMRDLVKEKIALREASAEGGLLTTKEARELELRDARDLLQIQQEIAALKIETNDFTFFERFSDGLAELVEQTQNVGASIADVLTHGVGDAIHSVSDGIWSVIDGTASWGDVFLQVGRRIISNLLEIVITQGILRAAMLVTAAVAEAVGARQVAASIRSFTASAAAGAGKSGEQGGWVGLLIYLAVLAATVGAIGAMAGGFEKGGVVAGGEQLIRVNESGTESVLNARATSLLGPEMINALNAGGLGVADFQQRLAGSVEPPTDAAAQPYGYSETRSATGQTVQGGGERQPIQLTIIMVKDKSEGLEAMKSAAGQAYMMDLMRENKTEIGIS